MMEIFSLFHKINKSSFKFPIQKYIFIIILLFNNIPLYYSFSLDIKVTSPMNIYNNKNNKFYTKRELSPQIQDVFGSMFKLNYYYTNLYIGDSKEKQGLILDTGSSITTSTCSKCKNCGKHIHPPYNIGSSKNILSCKDKKCSMLSSKCKDSKCSFSIKYAEGSSLQGIFINKKIFFDNKEENNNIIEIPFGCTLSENNLFYKQEVNGIMGLNNNEYNFVEILYKLKRIERNIFSLCFAQLGGIFTVGEINNKFHKNNITYVPMRKERNKYYKINVNSISVNNKKLESYSKEENNFLLDSGATITYFNNKIFEEILDKTLEICKEYNKKDICGSYKLSNIYGHCFYFKNINELNRAIKKYWPIIHFNIDGYDYRWLPENYIFNITSKKSIGACMGFYKVHKKKNTLGSSWIIGHDIIFDRENKLLGFVEADCYQNKNLNKTNGLELIDINKNEYYKGENKSFSFSNFIFIDILLSGIIISVIIYIILKKYKRKRNKPENKTSIEISSEKHLNNSIISNSNIINKNLI